MSNTHSSANDVSLEKDFTQNGNMGGNNYHMHENETSESALRRIRTAGSISISPELFEKLYLSPENKVSGDLRKTFGNPTPIAMVGFLLSLTPLSCDLMGWRGAGGNGAASTGVFFAFGGILMILGSLGEWIIGNTFPFVVFGTFGAFWLTFAMTLVPFFNSYGAYAPATAANAAVQSGNPGNPLGLQSPAFNSSFAFFMVFMGLICLVFLVCSLRTNIAFFIIFFTLVCAFGCLAGAYFNLALVYKNPENVQAAANATKLVVAGGAFSFVTCLSGWWIFTAIMLASLDFPLALPVGDLSHIIKGASMRKSAADQV